MYKYVLIDSPKTMNGLSKEFHEDTAFRKRWFYF